MSATDDLVQNAGGYAARFAKRQLPVQPARRVAIVACMDARLNPNTLFGLAEGDAHIIRNAGGIVTPDVVRSLAISQRRLGTEEIVLVHHTGCGMLTFSDEEFGDAIESDAGVRPDWTAGSFSDLDQDVRQSIALIKASPFIPNTDWVRGFVYDVETGELREIT